MFNMYHCCFICFMKTPLARDVSGRIPSGLIGPAPLPNHRTTVMTAFYFPEATMEWERLELPAMTAAAQQIAKMETAIPVDLAAFKLHENAVEYAEGEHAPLIGPMPDRGPATGIVLKGGRVVASWGMPERQDTAFSLTKGCLGLLTAMAVERSLIPALDAPVSASVGIQEFQGANAVVTWRQLMTLTSEWRGRIAGIPDSIDFHRNVPKRPDDPPKGSPRERAAPGEYWEFNDVRVNAFALALTQAWGEGLEAVLDREIMAPIGAGPGWRWYGYEGWTTVIGGEPVPVVSGGAHWGGGLIASSWDLARIGLLYQQRGMWGDRQLVSPLWFDALRSGSRLKPEFGLIWWNNSRATIPVLSPQAIWSSGISNFLLVDPELDLVVVLRWFDVPRRDAILTMIREALA